MPKHRQLSMNDQLLLGDVADFHAETSARMSFRSEAFTFFDVRKTLATSGANTTTFVPSVYRFAYFPRRPCEKSYSSRIPLVDFFFIGLSLSSIRSPRADDTDIIASVGVHDNEQFSVERCSDCYIATFSY
jgi:hypothetical protein